jgi:hypothetical protein
VDESGKIAEENSVKDTADVKNSWKGVSTVDEVKQLVDYGILLKWREMRTLKRNFTEAQQCDIIRHMTKRMCERSESRLSAEIVIESFLIWVSTAASEALVDAFLDQMFDEPGRESASRTLVEVALTSEVTDNGHDEQIFSTAVILICELGLAIYTFDRDNPNNFPGAKKLLEHIATYLLSVSNHNNSRIRLSLMHYFGRTTANIEDKVSFNRVMSRFGHTILDQLFSQLFDKRSEAIALRFLLDNLPFVLQGDIHSQKILHETLKYYMLKQPERFALFMHAFVDHVKIFAKEHQNKKARTCLLQHLGALLNLVSEVNHRILGREILVAICRFENDAFRDALLNQIAKEATMRPSFKELLLQIRGVNSVAELENAAAKFGATKRGRKPSFAKVGYIGTMDQVTFLGTIEAGKAS